MIFSTDEPIGSLYCWFSGPRETIHEIFNKLNRPNLFSINNVLQNHPKVSVYFGVTANDPFIMIENAKLLNLKGKQVSFGGQSRPLVSMLESFQKGKIPQNYVTFGTFIVSGITPKQSMTLETLFFNYYYALFPNQVLNELFLWNLSMIIPCFNLIVLLQECFVEHFNSSRPFYRGLGAFDNRVEKRLDFDGWLFHNKLWSRQILSQKSNNAGDCAATFNDLKKLPETEFAHAYFVEIESKFTIIAIRNMEHFNGFDQIQSENISKEMWQKPHFIQLVRCLIRELWDYTHNVSALRHNEAAGVSYFIFFSNFLFLL